MRYMISDEITTNGCRFIILPPNNRNQPLGVSPWYSTIDECKKAKRKFLFLIFSKEINRADEKYIKIEREMVEQKDQDDSILLIPNYKFYYYDDHNELVFFRKNGFFQKRNCIQCLISIYNAVVENYNLI